ncbi:hypothetical protein JHK84_056177 [Glycine max]|nr:hypothetical protein JHK84_056177 [Glycine max]
MGSFNGCFSDNFGIRNTLCAEFMGVILTIELADRNGWNNLWLDGRTTFSEKATPVQKLLPLLLLLFLDSKKGLTPKIGAEGEKSGNVREGRNC